MGEQASVGDQARLCRQTHLRGHRLPAWQQTRIAVVDEALVRLGRGGGALRLWLGEVLQAMSTRGMHHALGFSSLGAYALERCGRSERWAMDTCAVTRQLAKLLKLRVALLQGEVSWCMAAEVARHATPENETFLVALAKRSSGRRMRALFRQQSETGDGSEAGEEGFPVRWLGDAGEEGFPVRRRVRRRVDHEVGGAVRGHARVGANSCWESRLGRRLGGVAGGGGDCRSERLRRSFGSRMFGARRPPN